MDMSHQSGYAMPKLGWTGAVDGAVDGQKKNKKKQKTTTTTTGRLNPIIIMRFIANKFENVNAEGERMWSVL